MPRGKRDWIKTYEIPIPPLAEQKRIVAKIDAAFEKIDKLKANAEKNLANAKELFQSTLDEAMKPKEGWVEKRLGEVCEIKTGKKNVNQGNSNGTYPFFTCSRKPTRSDTYSFDCSALLIAGNGDVGFTQKYEGKFEAYQRTYVLSAFSGVDIDYLFFLLRSKLRIHAQKKQLGVAMPYIKMGVLKDFPFYLAPISEQKKIAGYLDAFSKKTEILQQNYGRQIAACAEMRQAILREAFEGRL